MTLMKKHLCQFIILLFSFLFFTSCNHLLYPAVREPFIDKKFIRPQPPVDVWIPVNKTEKLHAWYFESSAKNKKGQIVHFHGNGQNLTTHFMFFKWAVDLGFDYYIFDYRGYGQSSDDQATQEKTVQDGQAVLRFVYSKNPQLPVIAVAQSLGTNVLSRTLQEIEPSFYPQMVVFDSSFLSYQAAARSTLKQRWFLYPLIPLTYLVLDDTWSGYVQTAKSPVLPALFFHGASDSMIRMELGQQAYDLWPGPKQWILDSDGTHTGTFADPRYAQKNREIFLKCYEAAVLKKASFNDCAR